MHALSLFLITIIVAINAEVTRATIETDANGFTAFRKTLLDIPAYGPAHTQDAMLKCRLLKSCCPERRRGSFALLADRLFKEKCLSERTPMAHCKEAVDAYTEHQASAVMAAIGDFNRNNSERALKISIREKLMKSHCSQDELESLYCEPNDLAKYRTCQIKALSKLAATTGDGDYAKIVRIWQRDADRDNHQLRKAFATFRA